MGFTGSAIVMSAACEGGLLEHGRYASLLAEAGSPQMVLEMLARLGFCLQNQGQVQIQAEIKLRAALHAHSGGLSDDQFRRALFAPCPDIEQAATCLQQQ